MITSADFKIRFPEFACGDESRIDMFIAEAVLILNEAHWEVKYDLGLSYYTAHILTMADKTAAGNKGSVAPRSGRSVDGTSVSYSTGNVGSGGKSGDAWINATAYGQRYLALRNSLRVAAYVV